jgi:hypothetical protein
MFAIDLDKVCFVIARARQLDAKENTLEEESAYLTGEEEEGSNPIDEDFREVLEDHPDDSSRDELSSFIRDLNEDEQIELVALAWIGRGSFAREEWREAYAEARRAHNDRTAEYLLGMPLLADYLSEGLAAFGRACDE